MSRAIARLAPAAILSFILQNAYTQLDAYFLGQLSGAASNALGLFMMVQIANFGFILTLTRGTQSLVGRRIGAGQSRGAALALTQGLGLGLRLVVPLAVVQWIFAPQLLAFMGGEGESLQLATQFLRTLFFFLPFLFLSPILDAAFQALGDTGTPFRLQCLALAVNAALNWMLVLPHTWTLGGADLEFGGWGVSGSALATGLSRALSGLLGLFILARRGAFGGILRGANYRADASVMREILRVGLPAGLSTFLYAIIGMILLQIIGRFGQDAYGAYGIGFRGVESFSFMIVLGLGVGTGTVVAHAVGAGDFARARRAGSVGAALGLSAMLVMMSVFLTFPRELAAIYTQDPRILDTAADYIRMMAWCQVPQALEMILGDSMAAAGSSLRTALISIPGNLLRIPLAWFLAVSMGLGLVGVWWAIVISSILKGTAVTLLYVSRHWESAMHRGRQSLGDVA
ncbi:MAG: MATE family efflux transporter [Planctomycetota bacterium]